MSLRPDASSLGVRDRPTRGSMTSPSEGDVGAVGSLSARHRHARRAAAVRLLPDHRVAEGRAIGGIGFKGRPEDGCAEIGYGLAPSARGQGYAAEAVVALPAVAADHGLSRVIA